ncbi:HEWD family protein [Natronobacterium gregoryi]|uniref:HEWD domain-containing protein n=2 Tax=Natronobacterium gregoryi TaxID=44930 RepID=L0AM01_NATGS|nr:HEWD family protein [Natronobacterium gregoryi]AFZ74075.1 hypothetical protein Natgr_2937 [Natronobacterium gregoryi SP2]ELY70376.1 hypothetical protein C490_06709 [Natronobacterium gregoryi SP2]PLK20815.1 hypothetical protein CYV19_07875 [Natronobacterium gregoryi SP2]SFJ06123.1 hypothetical protein SAMN05443661_1135 [Natronobacterium gregoryi]
MAAQVRTPTARSCERCGRAERWDDDCETWQLDRDGTEKRVGNPHCLHEWDINGTFNPVVEDDA